MCVLQLKVFYIQGSGKGHGKYVLSMFSLLLSLETESYSVEMICVLSPSVDTVPPKDIRLSEIWLIPMNW